MVRAAILVVTLALAVASSTAIEFTGEPLGLSVGPTAKGSILLQVMDATGRMVREHHAAGIASAPLQWRWDGRDGADRRLPAGPYFVRLRTSEGVVAGRGCLIR